MKKSTKIGKMKKTKIKKFKKKAQLINMKEIMMKTKKIIKKAVTLRMLKTKKISKRMKMK